MRDKRRSQPSPFHFSSALEISVTRITCSMFLFVLAMAPSPARHSRSFGLSSETVKGHGFACGVVEECQMHSAVAPLVPSRSRRRRQRTSTVPSPSRPPKPPAGQSPPPRATTPGSGPFPPAGDVFRAFPALPPRQALFAPHERQRAISTLSESSRMEIPVFWETSLAPQNEKLEKLWEMSRSIRN